MIPMEDLTDVTLAIENTDEDDLYIIGAVCLCVCLSQKSLFLYSKDLVVPHVSRHIPY